MQTGTMNKQLLPALPASAPVFKYRGEEYIGRPYDVDIVGKGTLERLITLTTEDEEGDWPAVLPCMHEGKIKPLTRAARELLAWSKGKA